MVKSRKDRLDECIAIRTQLRSYAHDDSEYGTLNACMVRFVRDATPCTGSLYLRGIGKTLEYVLSTKHESYAVIKQM